MKKIALLGVLFVFFMANLAFARGPRWGGMNFPHGKFWQLPEVSEKLKITEEEKSQLDSLFFKHKEKMIDLRTATQKERLNLEKLMSNKELDETAVMTQFKKVQDVHTQLGVERFTFILETRKILGTDRFEQLRGIFKERRMKRGCSKFGGGRGSGPKGPGQF